MAKHEKSAVVSGLRARDGGTPEDGLDTSPHAGAKVSPACLPSRTLRMGVPQHPSNRWHQEDPGWDAHVTELATERLLLRPISASDFEEHARITSDPEVMRYISGAPLSRAQAWWNVARYVGHWAVRGYGMWVVIERANGALIGHMGFLNPEGGHGFELGWALERAAWGRGLALEGARAAVAHAFEVLGQRHIACVIEPGNVRSIRVAERLGATLEADLLESGKRLLLYGITRRGEP